MSYRPEGFKNPYPQYPKPIMLPSEWAIFEAGADAMLQALKENSLIWHISGKGFLVLIPDDNGFNPRPRTGSDLSGYVRNITRR